MDHLQLDRHHCQLSGPQQCHVLPAFQLQVLPGLSPHAPHWQSLPHTCCPQHTVVLPVEHMQSFVSPGAQAPSPVQPPSCHVHAPVHVDVRLPQFPHDSVFVSPGAQMPPPVQGPVSHWQDELHVSAWLAQLPQAWELVSPGEQAP